MTSLRWHSLQTHAPTLPLPIKARIGRRVIRNITLDELEALSAYKRVITWRYLRLPKLAEVSPCS